MKELLVGDIVLVKPSFLSNPANSYGFVYEIYPRGKELGYGVSIILENGCNLGGFSPDEQSKYLSFVCSSDVDYTFANVTKLQRDFNNVIKPIC